MGKLIYIDFQERKRVDDPQIRSELVVGRFDTYRKIVGDNLTLVLNFGNFLKEIAVALKGDN